jgi:ribonuclease Y
VILLAVVALVLLIVVAVLVVALLRRPRSAVGPDRSAAAGPQRTGAASAAPLESAQPRTEPAVADSAGRGSEARGSEARGTEARGSEARGSEARGTEARGTEARGSEARGTAAGEPGTVTRQAADPGARGGETVEPAAEIDAARRAAAEISGQADRRREQVEQEIRQLRAELVGERRELERRERRFDDRDRRLADEVERSAARGVALDGRDAELAAAQKALAADREQHRAELERISVLTSDQARTELLAAVEAETRRSAALLARDIEAAARADADRTARTIITTAIQRLASEQTSESVVTTVALPADEMKGRIIGREGRNIRAFEQITGVNVIIDDTPDAVVLSCFDPVRRETARVALESLIADGRIHPHRIEETYAIASRDVEQRCRSAAEEALLEVGIGLTDLHPELVTTLGHLRYRTSYGQNVLRHLVECAHLAGLMAAELGLDPVLPKRCAFLHDLGKALTHQVDGSHALVGAELARRCGEHPDVVHAIEAHHNEVEPRTVEALLTQAADAISGGRPGARRESLEAYTQRLHRLEEIASAHPGVDRVFAMQAGREVKVMVLPEHVDDLGAQVLAREIVKEIEDELTYPGQIRVTVVRESRATEIAR